MSSFLQSPEWEAIQNRMGRKTARIGGALVIQHELPLGLSYIYSPRPEGLQSASPKLLAECANNFGAIFLKIDPRYGDSFDYGGVSAEPLQAPATVLIDCRLDQPQLLRAMHPKTRYNIGVAKRRGVSVRAVSQGDLLEELPKFLSLLRTTAVRDRFSLHPEGHYRTLFQVASDTFRNQLWLAEAGGETLAGAIINCYLPSGTLTYLHGASANARRELMAPHLLHGEIIFQAKTSGFRYYDLGGIDEERWPGLTRFKKGFGGATIIYPASRDVLFRPWLYRAYLWQRRMRRPR